jgi:plastocyanin
VSPRNLLYGLAALLAVGGLALVVAGVLDDDDSASPPEATGATIPNLQLEPGQIAAVARSFFPNPVSGEAGGTITFLNADDATHTVTFDDGSFDSGSVAPGDEADIDVPETGPVTFHCKFHPQMTGTIEVVPAGG